MSLKRLVRSAPLTADYGNSFALGATSGIIPATPLSNKEIFQFRWNPASASYYAIIRKIEVSAAVSTTYFAAGVPVEFTLTKATAWSGQGTLGSAVSIGSDLKRSAAMASSQLTTAGDVRIAGTDANGLGAGTKTLETTALCSILSGAPITSSLSGQIFAPGTELLRGKVGDGDYPLVLKSAAAATSEGFVIRATAPATGTWRVSVNVEWDEVTDWPYSRTL